MTATETKPTETPKSAEPAETKPTPKSEPKAAEPAETKAAPKPAEPKAAEPAKTEAEPAPKSTEQKPAPKSKTEPTPKSKAAAAKQKKLAPASLPPGLYGKPAQSAISIKKSKKKSGELEFQLLHFRTNGRPTLEDVAKLKFPSLTKDKGAVIVGGRTEWVSALTAYCIDNNLPWVAIYDPRHGKNGGALVTSSYSESPKLWDLIEFELNKV